MVLTVVAVVLRVNAALVCCLVGTVLIGFITPAALVRFNVVVSVHVPVEHVERHKSFAAYFTLVPLLLLGGVYGHDVSVEVCHTGKLFVAVRTRLGRVVQTPDVGFQLADILEVFPTVVAEQTFQQLPVIKNVVSLHMLLETTRMVECFATLKAEVRMHEVRLRLQPRLPFPNVYFVNQNAMTILFRLVGKVFLT